MFGRDGGAALRVTGGADADDLDPEGRLFSWVVVPFVAALLLRWALAEVSGVSLQENWVAGYAAVCLALLVGATVLPGRGYPQAALALRSLFLLVSTMPFARDMLVAAIHAGRHGPYRDDVLAAWDAAIGFDWLAYARAFDASPVAWMASKIAYSFMFAQLPVLVFALAYSGRAARLYALMAAAASALAACCLVVVFFPALGAYAHAGGPRAGFVHADFVTGEGMTATLDWLRGESPVGLASELGLISFPSYHSVCAVLGIWAAWRLPRLRWVFLVADLLMLAVTPLQGSHYVVDVFAGVAIAVASIAACRAGVDFAAARSGAPVGPAASRSPAGVVPAPQMLA